MAFDFKKEYKEFYMPTGKPELVTVPPANYIAVRGQGDPNQEGGAYKASIGVLYALAYTLKMSYRGGRQIEGFYQYVVPPLEGFWRQEGVEGFDPRRKSGFHWISVIRLRSSSGRRILIGPQGKPPGKRAWTAPARSS